MIYNTKRGITAQLNLITASDIILTMLQKNTFIYYITQLFHSLIFTAPIWIVFLTLKEITPGEISILVTATYLSQMIFELPSGALADLIGRRNTLFLSYLLSFSAFLSLPFASSFPQFLLLMILMGMGDSFRSGSEEALIYDTYKQEGREDEISKVFRNGINIYQVGLIISSVSGGILYGLNISLPYFLYAGFLIVGAIFVIFFIEPNIDSNKFTLKNYFNQIIVGAKEAFKSDKARLISLFYIFVGGIAWSSTLYFNEYMLVYLGFSDSFRGIASGVMRAINILLVALALRSSEKFGIKRAVLLFISAMMIAYIPGIFLKGYEGLPFIQIAMFVTTSRWIVLAPITNQMFESKYRATAISFLSLMIGFVYIFLTSVSSYVIPNFGMNTMYSILGIFALLTVVPVGLRLMRYSETQENKKWS